MESFRSRLNEFYLHPELLPRHKIFVSHSGKQKDFAEQLCKDLEDCHYHPFFDKRPHSLPKGEDYPTRIFQAARECFLFIVLLSEEFLISKWPMLELATRVCAQKSSSHMNILPVLLGSLQPEDLKDTSRWSQHWTKLAEEDRRIDPREWGAALCALRSMNMLLQTKFDGEVALRSEIVNIVLQWIPSDVRADVSNVHGKEHLYEEVMACFSKIGTSQSGLCKNASVVGVYGVAGAGKSTICRIFTHFMNGPFRGRACHVELGKENFDTLKVQREALRQLTGANQDFLHMHINNEAEGWTCLKERMPRQQVFLALDDVTDRWESLDIASKFLYDLEYHADSMVFVTSRSKYVLEKVLENPESCCMRCPHVTTKEAEKIVLDHIGLQSIEGLTEEQGHILQKTVEMCDFGGFHPMALKMRATQLGRNPSSWKLPSSSLLEASDRENILFRQMGTIFEGLPDQQTRDMFMDIALFTPEAVNSVHELCVWLMGTLPPHCRSVAHVKTKLNFLKFASLLEVWSLDSDNVCIHDLHRELAKQKAQVDNASDTEARRFVYQTGGKFDPPMLENTERACFIDTSCPRVNFVGCSKLKLLSARSCRNLVELRLLGLARLVSLELSECPVETLDLKGLNELRWLCLTSCKCLMTLGTSDCKALVCVSISKCDELVALEMKNSEVLESVSVSYNDNLELLDLGNGSCLRCLTVWFCEFLREVKTSKSLCLDEFKKRGCPVLWNSQGLQKMSQDVSCLIVTRWHKISEELITALEASKRLQVLDLWDCPINKLPDLRNCWSLRELKLSDVDVVLDSDNCGLLHEYVDILCASNDELALPVSLQEVTIGNCRNTVVKEVCWKIHGLQNILVLLMQRVRVVWDWELYRSSSKAFSQSSSVDECNLESLKDELHQKIGIESEKSSDAGLSYSDEDQSCSDEECVEESSCIGDEIASEASSFQQTAQASSTAFASNEFETRRLAFIKMISNVVYWIQEFLGDDGMQSQVKEIITNSWQKQPLQLPLRDYQNKPLSWDEIMKVRYRSPDYVLLETFDNFDTLQTLFSIMEADKGVPHILSTLMEVTVAELSQQWMLWQAQYCEFDFEPWEQKVMDEIFLCEHLLLLSQEKGDEKVMWEKPTGDGSILSFRRWKELEKILLSLMDRRKIQGLHSFENLIVQKDNFGQWKQDWLKSCKVCVSMQVLCGLLDWGDLQAYSSLRQCLTEMMRAVDGLLRRVVDELETNSITEDDVKLEDLMRAWKARQWLCKLALSLSTKWVEEDIRERLAVASSTPEANKPEDMEPGEVEWLNKYRIIEYAIRQEGIKWGLSNFCAWDSIERRLGQGASQSPSNYWKEAALQNPWLLPAGDQLQSEVDAAIRELRDRGAVAMDCLFKDFEKIEFLLGMGEFKPSFEDFEELENLGQARLHYLVHDMLIRFQLIPSDSAIHKTWFPHVVSLDFSGSSLNLAQLDFPGNQDYFSAIRRVQNFCDNFECLLFRRDWRDIPLKHVNLINYFVTVCSEFEMLARLPGDFRQLSENLIRRPLVCQICSKAESFPLRTAWDVVNNGRQFVLPLRSKPHQLHISTANSISRLDSLVVPPEYKNYEPSSIFHFFNKQ